jgi:uncharacterized protein YndB with AHSA1/START domain
MPKQKDLKRIVRARMVKTGESYTAARAQVTRKPATNPPEPETPDYAALAGMSDETVKAKTGKSLAQWVELLDRIGAQSLPHGQIAKYVSENFEISGWWSQSITVGYERIRGLRAIGQRRSGEFEANKSKTFAVPVEKLHRAFAQARTRKQWLDVEVTVRKSTPPKSIRMTWPDETSVEVTFADKGPAKSQLAVQHKKLSSAAEAKRLKEDWTKRLDALAQLLTR